MWMEVLMQLTPKTLLKSDDRFCGVAMAEITSLFLQNKKCF
jgi:hypothetical protein